MEFSMALNRSPANMETEGGDKLELTLWFEVSKGGGGSFSIIKSSPITQ